MQTPPPVRLRNAELSFERPLLMGIVNVTPDSFSDGGRYLDPAAAVEHAHRLVEAGADIIDLGAESTRPGSTPVPAETELERLLPVVRALKRDLATPLSIDTYKAAVAEATLAEGADLINDISGLFADEAMAGVVAKYGVPVVCMHRRPFDRPVDGDVWADVIAGLRRSLERAQAAGIDPAQVIVDPGFGFGKTDAQNLQLIGELHRLHELGRPILIGPSRKSTIGRVLNLPVEQRLGGTAALAAIAVMQGAHIVRLHDVAELASVVRMAAEVARVSRKPAPEQAAAQGRP